jgi:hypothetical protein
VKYLCFEIAWVYIDIYRYRHRYVNLRISLKTELKNKFNNVTGHEINA